MTFLLLYWRWIALAAVIGALTIGYNVHVDRLIDKSVTKAVTERDGEWRKSETAAIQAADAKARATEAAHAKELVTLETKYQKETADATKQADARIASVHAGYRLRLTAGCTGSVDDPKATAASTGSDGPAGGQFLGEADSAFLVSEAERADAIVRELALCQATVTADRQLE